MADRFVCGNGLSEGVAKQHILIKNFRNFCIQRVYVDFPSREERAEIFRVHLQMRGKLSGHIQPDRLAQATDGYSGADIESVVKEAIEQAFVDGRSPLDTDRLLKVIDNTYPLREVMKKKVKEYADRFAEMKIKPAS